jgi:DnaA family protein
VSQLALPIGLADHAVFDSFHARGNEAVVEHLKGIAERRDASGCWLCGAAATGKTHLLQAVCDRAADSAAYLPMRRLRDEDPGLVDGLEHRAVICLDDIEAVAGNAAWERALFGLYNALQSTGASLVVAAAMPPRECPLELPDLLSRMMQLPTFVLHALSDEERAAALQLRAGHRGLDLPDETANYLLSRSRRDMASLYDTLDALDREALRTKRRLTIPFVREVLARRAESGRTR